MTARVALSSQTCYSKAKSSVILSLEQTEQRSLCLVQMSSAIIDQLLHGFKVALDHLTSLETI